MPPRGNEGLDFTPLLTHYLFLFTSILAVIAWFIAFVGQAVSEATHRGSVGTLWFAIFLELFFILGVLYTLASDSIAMHRFQISVFGAVAIVFAVNGVNAGIFTGVAALDAMSAGWLILSIVNILWVLYFTSEEDSLMLYIFNSMGTGGLTPPSRRRRTRTQSVHNMTTNNGYTGSFAPGVGIGPNDVSYGQKMESMGVRSQNSFNAGSLEGGAATRSIGGTGAGSIGNAGVGNTSMGGMGSEVGPNSPLMGSGNAGVGAGGTISGTGSPPPGRGTTMSEVDAQPETFSYRAKALYAYTASPDDPNEISFSKGEILDIVDKQGKWWQAKKADGTIGIAPSNYLQII